MVSVVAFVCVIVLVNVGSVGSTVFLNINWGFSLIVVLALVIRAPLCVFVLVL